MNTNIVALPNCPKSQKKSFASEADAAKWEGGNRASYGGAHQYAYSCDGCGYWHLTKLLPGAPVLAKSHLGESTIETVEDAELFRLRESGLSAKAVGERFGISEQVVYTRTAKYRAEKGLVITRARLQPVTLDQVSEKKAELERQMEEMRRKVDEMQRVEQRLIDDQKLKFEVNGNLVTLRKKHEQITITKEELQALHEGVTL
jgi:transposase